MKKRIFNLFAILCVGVLVLTGCQDTNTESDASDAQISDTQYTPDIANDNTGNSDEEKNTAQSENEGTTEDVFADTNDLFLSADAAGTASKCSNSGCMISTDDFANVDSENNVSTPGNGGNVSIVYNDETLFQKGIVKSDGSDYSLSACEKSSLKDNDYILVFGSLQTDNTYLATKIIVVEFDYN